jgi:hypothetical protein
MALRRKAKATFFACMFLVFAFQEMCEAAEWSASPSINLREDYDDNIFLSTQSHDTVTSTTVMPRLGFGIASDNWQVGGGAELTRRYFPGNSDLNTDAQTLSLGSSYRTERNIWQLSALSSKTSYLDERAINSNTGLFTQNTSSDTKTVSPTWTWLVTELTQLQLAYSQSDVSYVNGESSGLFDYHSSSLSAKLTKQFDISTQIFLSPAYSVFRVPATTFESKTTSYQVGITRTFSETMNGTFSVGGRNTSSEQTVSSIPSIPLSSGPSVCAFFGLPPNCLEVKTFSRNSSSIFSANLEKQFETVHLTAVVSRSFDAAAIGQQVQTDLASFSLSRPFTAKLTGNLATSGYKISSETGGVSGADNRRIYQIEPSLRWQWAPEWNLDAGYRYTHLQRVSETTAATSNVVYLTLTYQWPKISISR